VPTEPGRLREVTTYFLRLGSTAIGHTHRLRIHGGDPGLTYLGVVVATPGANVGTYSYGAAGIFTYVAPA
jgi:hypothetical protein